MKDMMNSEETRFEYGKSDPRLCVGSSAGSPLHNLPQQTKPRTAVPAEGSEGGISYA